MYGEDPPERGTFFRLQVSERVEISLVQADERAGNLSFWSEKRLKKGQQMRFNVCEKVTKTFWFGDLLIL